MTVNLEKPTCLEWNEEAHQEVLKHGYSLYSSQGKSDSKYVYIDKMTSRTPGFGTATYREAFKLSLKEGSSEIRTQAAWSSHLFHLYMGMEPDDKEIWLLEVKYGSFAREAIKKIPSIKKCVESGTALSDNKQAYILDLKRILSTELGIPRKSVTMEQIFENKELFTSLLDKTCFYVPDDFIKQIISCLKSNAARPDTSRLTSVNMHMSEEGKKRWKETIEQNKPFVPFKKFEHMHYKLRPEQIEQIESLVSSRIQQQASRVNVHLPPSSGDEKLLKCRNIY